VRAFGDYFLRTPTIVAWDLSAAGRILPIEARLETAGIGEGALFIRHR
jgi:hypothetical protein